MPSSASVARPLVSCLMVTEDRFEFAKRAIRCFADQTWPEKELVILSQGTDEYRRLLTEHVQALGRTDVLVRFVEPGHNLGQLRNLSLDTMRGEIFAVWDDDDLSHPDRLAVQIETMLAEDTRACFLGERFQWFSAHGLVFWTDHSTYGGPRRGFLNTLVAWREPDVRYPERGPFASVGEDTVFINALCDRVPFTVVEGRGALFAYTLHGTNTFAQLHQVHIARQRARPVAEWPRAAHEALEWLDRLGATARPAGPDAAQRIWDEESSKTDAVRVRRLLGSVALWEGDLEEMRRQVTPDVARGDPRAWFELGRVALRSERFAEAESAFREALVLEPSFPEAWGGLGDALLRQGRFAEAEEAFRKVVAFGAPDAASLAGLGLAMARQGRVRDACEPLRQAVLRAPRTHLWHQMLIGGMRDAGVGAAELGAIYADLCAQRPYSSRVHLSRGILASEAGRAAEALASWQRAAELDPRDPEPWLHLGEEALRSGAPRRAVEHLRRAIGVDPRDARGHTLLGVALRAVGDPAGAVVALEQALSVDRSSTLALYELSRARSACGDPAGALDAVERILVRYPDHEAALALRDQLRPVVARAGRAPRSDPWSRLDTRWALPPAPVGDRPVFVLAAGWRSGSTLMQRLIAASGEVFMWGEPYGHAAIVSTLAERTRAFDDQWPDAAFIVPDGPVSFSESWVANLAPHPSALKTALRALLDGLLVAPARGRAPRWGLKEVRFGADEARFLRWLYPDARFVFLVRNPWDAWSSYAGRRWLLRWPDRPVETPEAFATHWARLVADFVSWPFDDALLVRHEDVVGPAPPLDALAAHLGLERLDPSPLGALVRGDIPAPRVVDPDTVARIDAVVGDSARRLGYEGPRRERAR